VRESPPGGRARFSLRVLRTLSLLALAGEGFYLVAMNVFLSTPLFEMAIDGTPLIVDIHYERGWSFFPTRIHARGLSIRGTDSHVEWILRFDEVDFDCSLLALARQRFHVTRARGSGISFRARMKVAAPEATSAHVANLPAIDSLGPVGFIPSEPPSLAEWNDEAWHLWTVQIDDAVAEHVREIWIEGGRFEGDARVAGGFLLKPMRAAYVGPARVEVRRGSVGWEGRTVAEPLVASLNFELARFDPRYSTGADILPRISLAIDATTRIPNVDNLGASLPGAARVEGELEVPRLALRVVEGVLRDGTHIEARGAKLRGTTGAHVVAGDVSVTAEVVKERLTVLLSLAAIDADSAISIARASVSADSSALALADPFTDLHGVLDVPAAEVDQARRLSDDLPADARIRISGGRLHASLHAEGWRADDRVGGSMALRGRDLEAMVEDVRVRGDADLEVSVGALLFDARRATDVRLGLEVLRGFVAPPVALPGAPFVRVSGLHASAVAGAVELDHPLRAWRATVTVRDGELLDRSVIRAPRGGWPIVHHAPFALAAAATLDGDRATASLDLSAPRLGVEFADRRLELDLTARARVHAAHWRSGTLSLDEASVVGRQVVISDGSSTPALSIGLLSLSAASPTFVIADPLAQVELVGAADGGRVLSFAALGGPFASGSVRFAPKEGATFSANVAAEITRHVARGAASVEVRDAAVSSAKLRIAGDVRADMDVARWDLAEQTLDGDLQFTARDVTGAFHPQESAPDFIAEPIEGRASVRGLDLARPSMRGVDYAFRLHRAELADARALNAFLPSPTILAIESGHAVVSADIGTSGPARSAVGRIDVALAGGGIRIHDTRLGGDFALAVQAHGFDPERAAVDLEGSHLEMRNVRITGAFTEESAWRGDLVLQAGTLALAATPRFEGDLTLQARDASPILGVLFQNTLPRFVAELTRMPSLAALTHVVVEPESLVVSDLSASGGDLAVRGTYVIRENVRHAAFVVHKGPWSVGVDLNNDGSHLRFFGLDRWYGEQSRQALAP
jgi:hypothetical protein